MQQIACTMKILSWRPVPRGRMEPDTFPSTDTVPVTDTDPVTNTDLGTDTVLVTVNDVANTIPVIVSIPTTTTTDVSIRDSVPVPYGRQGPACTTTEAVPGEVQVKSARLDNN